jgi:hypothetical protein
VIRCTLDEALQRLAGGLSSVPAPGEAQEQEHG